MPILPCLISWWFFYRLACKSNIITIFARSEMFLSSFIFFILSSYPIGLWPLVCTLLAITWLHLLIWLANYKCLQAVTWLCQLVWTASWWPGGTCASDWLITNPCRQSRDCVLSSDWLITNPCRQSCDCVSWSGHPAGDWAIPVHLIG